MSQPKRQHLPELGNFASNGDRAAILRPAKRAATLNNSQTATRLHCCAPSANIAAIRNSLISQCHISTTAVRKFGRRVSGLLSPGADAPRRRELGAGQVEAEKEAAAGREASNLGRYPVPIAARRAAQALRAAGGVRPPPPETRGEALVSSKPTSPRRNSLCLYSRGPFGLSEGWLRYSGPKCHG